MGDSSMECDVNAFVSAKSKADESFSRRDYKSAAHYYNLCKQFCELREDFLLAHLRLVESILLSDESAYGKDWYLDNLSLACNSKIFDVETKRLLLLCAVSEKFDDRRLNVDAVGNIYAHTKSEAHFNWLMWSLMTEGRYLEVVKRIDEKSLLNISLDVFWRRIRVLCEALIRMSRYEEAINRLDAASALRGEEPEWFSNFRSQLHFPLAKYNSETADFSVPSVAWRAVFEGDISVLPALQKMFDTGNMRIWLYPCFIHAIAVFSSYDESIRVARSIIKDSDYNENVKALVAQFVISELSESDLSAIAVPFKYNYIHLAIARFGADAELFSWLDACSGKPDKNTNRIINNLKAVKLNGIKTDVVNFSGKDFIYQKNEGADKLVLIFTGLNGTFFWPIPAVSTWFSQRKDVSVLWLQDKKQISYLGGIPGFGDDTESCRDALHEFIKKEGYKDFFMFGTSGGGTAALFGGATMGAKKVFAFSPPTLLKAASGENQTGVADILMRHSNGQELDIRAYLKERPEVEAHIVYSDGCIPDKEGALYLEGLPNVKFYPMYGSSGHDSFSPAVQEGLFDKFLQQI